MISNPKTTSSSEMTNEPGNENGELPDLEKQQQQGDNSGTETESSSLHNSAAASETTPHLTIVVSEGPSATAATSNFSKDVPSPKKGHLSRTASSHEQCRVCQQEKEEVLIDLGCRCRGGLAKSHRSCIDTWFRTRGSNKCEICQEVAANVPPPDSQPSHATYWVWRIDSTYRSQNHDRGCISPLWVAFSILIGGLLLDVLISVTLGVSALPINIIIGVIVVLGLGTALRLALEFCHEWSLRRVVNPRLDTNVPLGYHPAL